MTEKNKELEIQGKKEIENQKESITPLKRYSPATDIVETESELLIYMDMPGVSKENIQVKLEKNTLDILGHINSNLYQDLKPIYSEYNVGNFQRRFELSNDIDQSKIEAKVDSGVLTLVLPKIPERKPQVITVN